MAKQNRIVELSAIDNGKAVIPGCGIDEIAFNSDLFYCTRQRQAGDDARGKAAIVQRIEALFQLCAVVDTVVIAIGIVCAGADDHFGVVRQAISICVRRAIEYARSIRNFAAP